MFLYEQQDNSKSHGESREAYETIPSVLYATKFTILHPKFIQ